jgi:hypothetical protein
MTPTATFADRNASLFATAVPLAGHDGNLPAGLSAMGSQANNEMALTYGLFTGTGSRNWQIKAPGSYWSMDDAATATYNTLHQVWVRSPIAPPAAEVAPALDGLYPSCLELKTANASAPSGVYYLNISSQAVRAYCDMEDRGDGGGWMLVLNYVRGGGLNPSLQLRTISSGFPLLRSTRLGSDESWMRSSSGTWGHLNVATLSKARR